MSAEPAPDDLVLGTTTRPYPHPQFRLTPELQSAHGLIWGSTGTGKSKLLQALFLQHLSRGHGVCLLDPHSDLSEACLSYLVGAGFFQRPDAYEKLVYIDFEKGSHVPFNVLATPFDPHTRALNALEALTRTWPDLRGAPLFRTLFLSSAIVLIENKLPLTAVNQLLLDSEFRGQCLVAVTDPLVQQVFQFYDRHGKGQAGSTLRRAFLLSFSPVSRGVLGQVENVLNIRAMMDKGQSLLVNLGSISDPVTRRLIGSLLMVQIEQAALSRADTPPRARRPWTCLVDEWPSLSASSAETLENVLTQARKYNLRLYLAAQALSQVDSNRLAGALEQCRLSVTFRMGADSARLQARHIATIDPHRIKQRARTAAQRHQYMSTSEQIEEWVQAIMQLPPRGAFVRVDDRPPIRIKTLTVRDPVVEPGELDAVREEYRHRYQVGAVPKASRELVFDGIPADISESASDILTLDEKFTDHDIPLDFETFFGEPSPDDQPRP